jgi:hypothetical protein
MTTPLIHLGLKPQAIGSNPLKRVHESIGFLVVVSAEKVRILNRQYLMFEGTKKFKNRKWILFIGV